MDDGRGRFKMYDNIEEAKIFQDANPISGGIFQEGEEVEIKGSLFRISKIIRNGLKLELLPR